MRDNAFSFMLFFQLNANNYRQLILTYAMLLFMTTVRNRKAKPFSRPTFKNIFNAFLYIRKPLEKKRDLNRDTVKIFGKKMRRRATFSAFLEKQFQVKGMFFVDVF